MNFQILPYPPTLAIILLLYLQLTIFDELAISSFSLPATQWHYSNTGIFFYPNDADSESLQFKKQFTWLARVIKHFMEYIKTLEHTYIHTPGSTALPRPTTDWLSSRINYLLQLAIVDAKFAELSTSRVDTHSQKKLSLLQFIIVSNFYRDHFSSPSHTLL